MVIDCFSLYTFLQVELGNLLTKIESQIFGKEHFGGGFSKATQQKASLRTGSNPSLDVECTPRLFSRGQDEKRSFFNVLETPKGSMYGIFTYIYHKNQPNVGKYTIHGSYGTYC